MDIIFEDNHLLIINKPAVLATMGVAKGNDSLIHRAKQYIKTKHQKPGNVYLGVVSRLDAFVTGIVVFAKTSKAAARLNQQFSNSLPTKKYLAIVSSTKTKLPEQGKLEHWLYKDEIAHRMRATTNTLPNAKKAILTWSTIGQCDEGNTLLEIRLITGRKHQIRTQLSAIQCPIVGDRKYGSRKKFPKGIALHSTYLGLQHPTTRDEIQFHCPPPEYWKLERFY